MKFGRNLVRLGAAIALGCLLSVPAQSEPLAAAEDRLGNATCLGCHEGKAGKIEVVGKEGEKRKLSAVDLLKFGKSIHADMKCVDCHKEITDAKANHEKAKGVAGPNCVTCHQALWDQVKKDKQEGDK